MCTCNRPWSWACLKKEQCQDPKVGEQRLNKTKSEEALVHVPDVTIVRYTWVLRRVSVWVVVDVCVFLVVSVSMSVYGDVGVCVFDVVSVSVSVSVECVFVCIRVCIRVCVCLWRCLCLCVVFGCVCVLCVSVGALMLQFASVWWQSASVASWCLLCHVWSHLDFRVHIKCVVF